MSALERIGIGGFPDRDLFLFELERVGEFPDDLKLPSRFFVCLLAWDAKGVSAEEIRLLSKKLIVQGAAYFSIWGSDCERVHDLIDELEAMREESNPEDESVIMTTWHEDEPLSNAIWDALYCLPDEPYMEECRSVLAIAVDAPDWAAEIRSALSDPKQLSYEAVASPKKNGSV